MITVSQQTDRRYVLGKQGLWTSRRWKVEKANRQVSKTYSVQNIDKT